VHTTAKGEVFAGDHHAGIAEIGKPRRKMIGAPPGFLPNGVHVELGARSPLRNIASVAFGGADLKTVYLGNLAGDRIATFRSPIAGAEPVQWRF
jgi:hypothetical protein